MKYGYPDRPTVSALLAPAAGMDILSRGEIARLHDASVSGLKPLLRRCALAVMTQGLDTDDPRAALDSYRNFDIEVLQQDRGVRLRLTNAPASAFVDKRIIAGINEMLHAVLRDIVFTAVQIEAGRFALSDSAGITDAVFELLRHADVLRANVEPDLVVCWGGHSISRIEYDYTKEVGYELGLRQLDICTGCGPGAMKGPMKGATIGHLKQRRSGNRYIGITEPGIIAAESPNPIVNNLLILPDIEKRLEAFVRVAHTIIVFPGGAGTAEEILYLLGILMHPDNADMVFPLVFTGPPESAVYFEQIDEFLRLVFGDEVTQRYRIMIDDPVGVARHVVRQTELVRQSRLGSKDAFFFNWGLHIDDVFQRPFDPTHEAMAGLNLHRDQPAHLLAADLRRAFSGIVAGNVKEDGIQAVETHGPFVLDGDRQIMRALDRLLASFVAQMRMKLPGTHYIPCYTIRT